VPSRDIETCNLYEAKILSTLLHSAEGCVASNSRTNEKTVNAAYHRWQMPKICSRTLGHFLEGQNNKRRGHKTYSVKEDSAGLDIWYEWRCTRRFRSYCKRGSGRPHANCMEEHCQQGLVKDGNHLGGSRGGSFK